jgi:hypothetical protein
MINYNEALTDKVREKPIHFTTVVNGSIGVKAHIPSPKLPRSKHDFMATLLICKKICTLKQKHFVPLHQMHLVVRSPIS